MLDMLFVNVAAVGLFVSMVSIWIACRESYEFEGELAMPIFLTVIAGMVGALVFAGLLALLIWVPVLFWAIIAAGAVIIRIEVLRRAKKNADKKTTYEVKTFTEILRNLNLVK